MQSFLSIKDQPNILKNILKTFQRSAKHFRPARPWPSGRSTSSTNPSWRSARPGLCCFLFWNSFVAYVIIGQRVIRFTDVWSDHDMNLDDNEGVFNHCKTHLDFVPTQKKMKQRRQRLLEFIAHKRRNFSEL